MAILRICRWRIQRTDECFAGTLGFGEGIVDFEGDALGAAVAVALGNILALPLS